MYSSWPAVSRMSSWHLTPSTSMIFLYESAVVGSYSSTKLPYMNIWVSADFPAPPPHSPCARDSWPFLSLGRPSSFEKSCGGKKKRGSERERERERELE